MSVYTPPALNAVDFELSAYVPTSLDSPVMELSPYTVPSLSAVDFVLSAYTPPSLSNIGWELLPAAPAFRAAWLRLSGILGMGRH